MNKPIIYVLALLLLWSIAPEAEAQNRVAAGGGGLDLSDIERPLPEAERRAIQAAIDHNIEALRAAGKLPDATASAVSLTWPLRGAESLTDPGYHATTFFVDQNNGFPNQTRDFQCGQRTYDLDSGYNHGGTDYILWPFAWYKMDHRQVEIVAAAPGTIVLRLDGNFDRSCNFTTGSGTWNAVFVRHNDGSVAWYGHMQNGSLTSKDVGETVERGEFLGVVGSSGRSSIAHLHFEVRDAANNVIDPYSGPCNDLNDDSWWAEQPEYFDSGVNLVTTGGAAAEFPACPGQEKPNIQEEFDHGETIYFTTYYRDQRSGQVSRYSVFAPDGLTYDTWTHSISTAHFPASWWWWSATIPDTATAGQWMFRVEYEDEIYERAFRIGSVPTATEAATELPDGFRLSETYPNPFNPSARFTLELEQSQHVRLAAYDLLGRRVALRHDAHLAPGTVHTFTFEAGTLPSGLYLIEATGETFTATRRAVLMK